MPDPVQAKSLLEFLVTTYGQVALLLMAATGYFAWALNREQIAHQKTREMLVAMQEQDIKAHIDFVKVLAELKVLIESRTSK